MTSNAPNFDPLNPTPEEQEQVVEGYRDGFTGRPPPTVTSAAYDRQTSPAIVSFWPATVGLGEKGRRKISRRRCS